MYFSSEYVAAQTRFRSSLQKLQGRLEVLDLYLKGPAGEALTIDIGWIGAPNPRIAMLHSSGLHGVEGFAGSAVQLQLMDNVPALPRDAALILVHILNPFGMAWLRRVNENNVDLNRNFLTAQEEYAGAPVSYNEFDSFLNPRTPPSRDFLLFLFRAQRLIARYGMNALKQAIAGGQYEYPKGLFFGGQRLEEGPSRYKEFLKRRLASTEHVMAIDVHTGLGSYGNDTLIVEPAAYAALRKSFGERVAPSTAEKSPAYRVRGGIHSMIMDVAPHARVDCVCQEFGTFGPIRVLNALRQENRWHHYGTGSLRHSSKRALKHMFCPSDESWRRSVLAHGSALVSVACSQLLG